MRPDPALERGQGRAFGDRGSGEAPPLGDVDAEIGQREQPRGCFEDELGEVGRPFTA